MVTSGVFAKHPAFRSFILSYKSDQRHSAEFSFLTWSSEKISTLEYSKSRLIILIILSMMGLKLTKIYHILMLTIFHMKIKIISSVKFAMKMVFISSVFGKNLSCTFYYFFCINCNKCQLTSWFKTLKSSGLKDIIKKNLSR